MHVAQKPKRGSKVRVKFVTFDIKSSMSTLWRPEEFLRMCSEENPYEIHAADNDTTTTGSKAANHLNFCTSDQLFERFDLQMFLPLPNFIDTTGIQPSTSLCSFCNTTTADSRHTHSQHLEMSWRQWCERCLLIIEGPETPGHYRYLIWVLVYIPYTGLAVFSFAISRVPVYTAISSF